MLDRMHYVPILKGKAGEFDAIETLSATAKQAITPLLEMPPIGWDFRNDRPEATIDEHVDGFAEKILGAWGTADVAMLDLEQVDDQGPLSSGSDPLTFVLDAARSNGLKIVPVTGIDRPQEYQSAVAHAIGLDGRGLCLRLNGESLTQITVNPERLAELLDTLEVGPQQVDLVLDFESIYGIPTGPLQLTMLTMLTHLPMRDQWRSLTLAAGSMPEDMSDVQSNSAEIVPRPEWSLWVAIRASAPRRPQFGDYGVAHPSYVSLDMRLIYPRMTAKIRYTIDDAWLLVKGRSLKRHGYGQFRDLAAQIVARHEYCGAGFSWGDEYIAECASGIRGTGNLATWVSVATNHHLTFVVDRISSLVVTSAPV